MKIRTLIVDDMPLARELIKESLAGETDFEIIGECEDGGDAINAIKTLKPDLVFLDVQMPETDGFAVLRELRNDPASQQLPVILMSAAWRTQEKQRHIGSTLSVAPTVVLPKPFALADLDKCLQQLGVTA